MPLADVPAVALFVERAQAVKPGFELTDENREAVAEICRRLDGLPLAIELAAARVKLLDAGGDRSTGSRSGSTCSPAAPATAERQRTLRDAIEWSYNLLEPTASRRCSRASASSSAAASLEPAETPLPARR